MAFWHILRWIFISFLAIIDHFLVIPAAMEVLKGIYFKSGNCVAIIKILRFMHGTKVAELKKQKKLNFFRNEQKIKRKIIVSNDF